VLEFIRAELADVKKERDYYRDLLFQRLGVVPDPNHIPNSRRQIDPNQLIKMQARGTRSVRQRLEREDFAKYQERMKALEIEVLAKEIGLKESNG